MNEGTLPYTLCKLLSETGLPGIILDNSLCYTYIDTKEPMIRKRRSTLYGRSNIHIYTKTELNLHLRNKTNCKTTIGLAYTIIYKYSYIKIKQ